jgi:hypothetical protein
VENCTFAIVKEAKINVFVGGNIRANPTKQNKTKQKQAWPTKQKNPRGEFSWSLAAAMS